MRGMNFLESFGVVTFEDESTGGTHHADSLGKDTWNVDQLFL